MKHITKDETCNIIRENHDLYHLLKDILPDLKSHYKGLVKLWPGKEVLTALHRNETNIKRIEQFITKDIQPLKRKD